MIGKKTYKFKINKEGEGKLIKKLWCCVHRGGRYKIAWFYQVCNVNWPP